jgi:hypothetical protein
MMGTIIVLILKTQSRGRPREAAREVKVEDLIRRHGFPFFASVENMSYDN